MDDSQSVGFGQTFADLLGDTDGVPRGKLPNPLNHALEIFPRHIFHGDEMGPMGFAHIEHPADMLWGIFRAVFSSLWKRSRVFLSEAISGLISFKATLLIFFLSSTR